MEFSTIIEGCMEGDDTAKEELYKLFYPSVRKVCGKFSTSTLESEDFIQECFIRIYEVLPGFTGKTEGEFGGWAKKISSNYCIDHMRKDIPLLNESFIKHDITLEEDFKRDIEKDMSSLLEAVAKLKPRYKEVFNMYYFDGCSHKEIDDKLGLSSGTSKANLYKAKKRIKKILENND